MKKTWIGIIIFALVILAAVLVVTQTKKEPEEIKIGAILPLSGEFSSHGEDCKKGIDLVTDEQNKLGGINGKQISILYEDDQMRPSVGVSAFNKLITINKTKIIIGGIGSAVALAIAPIAERTKTVFISPTASNPNLLKAGAYIFKLWPSDIYEGGEMANFIINKFNENDIAILYVNNDYGRGLKDVFSKKFVELGGRIVIEEPYDQGGTDFRAQLSKILIKKPEGIYLPGYYQEVGKIAVQIKEMGVKTSIFSTSPIENPTLVQIAGNAAEGIIFTRPKISSDQSSELYSRFYNSFKNIYNTEPGIAAAFCYDAMKVIFVALSNTLLGPQLKTEDIRNKILIIKDFEGVTGKFSFDEDGNVKREISIYTIKNGKFVIWEDK